MTYQTLLVADIPQGISITLNRIEHRNTLNSLLITELHQALDHAETHSACKIIVIKGQQRIFCTGMDFQEVAQSGLSNADDIKQFVEHYMALLKRFALMPKIIIACVDGQVMAGGVGLVAASDIVFATSQSQFTLSEALWGLLPANVMPYLIRRVGFQKAYTMTLTTQALSAAEAKASHLVDEVNDQLDETLRKYLLHLSRLDKQTIHDIKNYFRKMWILDNSMEKTAIDELTRLLSESRIQNNIKHFVEEGKFPWEIMHE